MSAATLSLQAQPTRCGRSRRAAWAAARCWRWACTGCWWWRWRVSVNWRSQTPQTFSAELWAATPQVAAPRAVESTPVAPPPPPPPPPPAPTPRVATPAAAPAVDAADRHREGAAGKG